MIYSLDTCYFCKSKLQHYILAGLEQFGCRNLNCGSRYIVKWHDNSQSNVISFTYKDNYFSVYLEKETVHVNAPMPKQRFYTCFNKLVTPEKAIQMRSLYGQLHEG